MQPRSSGADRRPEPEGHDRHQTPETDQQRDRKSDGEGSPARLAQLAEVDRHPDRRQRDEDQVPGDPVERGRLLGVEDAAVRRAPSAEPQDEDRDCTTHPAPGGTLLQFYAGL